MQRLLFITLLVVAFASCQKEIELPVNNDYPELRLNLKQNVTEEDYKALDFSRVSRSRYGDVTLLRVPFKGKTLNESFVLVDVDATGRIKRGRIIALTRDKKVATYNGTLVIKDLKGLIMEETPLVNGYRQKNKVMTRSMVVQPDPYVELPEVVIVSTYPPSGGGISWGTYMNLLSFFNSDGGGGGGGWYSGGGGGGGSTGGSSGGSTGSGGTNNPGHPPNPDPYGPVGVVEDEQILIDFESQYADPAIDLEKFLKCFDNIPDAGANCKVTIHADVPVDSDPTKIMDWSTGSPGHTWIRIEKKGAGNSGSASQHIGFYPKSGWKTTLTDAPLDGKFVDNSQHEFNASYEVTVSPERLRSAITRIRQLKNVRYDIDDYNCTDWAIQVWREAVSPTLWFDIPRFHMPGSLAPNGTSTPQGLYVKIEELSNAGVSGAATPVIGWSGTSTGPCN